MTISVYDAGTVLATPGASIAATESKTGVQLNPRFLPTCDWLLNVSGVVATGTYTFTLEVSDVVGGTYTAIARYVWPPAQASGKVNIPINADLALTLDNDSRFMRTTVTIGGATPGIVYGSWLGKSANKLGQAVRQGDIVSSF